MSYSQYSCPHFFLTLINLVKGRETLKILFKAFFAACISCAFLSTTHAKDSPILLNSELVELGRKIFNEEQFGGNGRTCSTCHRPENNFTLDPEFISQLPDDDPLFIAEHDANLSKGFENPKLMRQFALILTNPDGFDDLENKFAMRGTPHLQSLKTTIDSVNGPRLGLSGDGGPLLLFANKAIKQHLTKSLARVEGIDFRLATPTELKALEAYMLSLGRQEEIKLPLALKNPIALRGQELFLDNDIGKCNICHINGGGNGIVKGVPSGNVNFDTGVEAMQDNLARLTGEKVPNDDGFSTPGDKAFNSVPVIESADTPPYMHNNSVVSLEGTVSFYNSIAFNESKTGKFLASIDKNGKGINLNNSQVNAISEFMRILNVLENIRSAQASLSMAMYPNQYQSRKQLMLDARHDIDDAIKVMSDVYGLYPKTLEKFDVVNERFETSSTFPFAFVIERTIKSLEEVKQELVH